jgi:hypothetical protein
MKATEIAKIANAEILSITKQGRRAEYKLISKNSLIFTLNVGSEHHILSTKEQTAKTIDGLKISFGVFCENNVRFALTAEEVISILKVN